MEERTNMQKRNTDEFKKCIDFQSKTIKKYFNMLKERNETIKEKEREIISLKFKIKVYERELKILRGKVNDTARN